MTKRAPFSYPILICVAFILPCATLQAQGPPMPTPVIREADAMWSKRMWREVDMRQKFNLVYYYPTESSQGYRSLFTALLPAVIQGQIRAYSPGVLGMRSSLDRILNPSEIQALMVQGDTISTPSLEGGYMDVVTSDTLSSSDITRFRIMEEWIFDRQLSRLIPRILAIAPMEEVRDEEGLIRGHRILFWLDYREIRPLLAQAPVQLGHSDDMDIDYADLFDKRYFQSYVTQVSNVYGRPIQTYARGVEALLESQRLEEELRNFESDLWSY